MKAETTNETQNANPEEDQAWVSVELPLTQLELMDFCQDVERLFRINPHLEVSHWTPLAQGGIRFAGKNNSQEKSFEFDVVLDIEPLEDGFYVTYKNGLKKSTRFKIEADPAGSKLTITDDYSGMTAEERQQRLHEVDRSLLVWVKDIRSYIHQWQRWKKFRLYRWYMRKVWQPLKPMGRRIVYMLIWISIFEVALIALGFAIYWAEYR